MTGDANPMQAFRRGGPRSRDPEPVSADTDAPESTSPQATSGADLDELIERRRAAAIANTRTERPPRAPSTAKPTKPSRQTSADTPGPDASPDAPRPPTIVVRTLNIPAPLVRGLRLLRAARSQDYIDLIDEAIDLHGDQIPISATQVKKRSWVQGEKVTIKIPVDLDRRINDLAETCNLNRSAFITAVLVKALPDVDMGSTSAAPAPPRTAR